MDCVVMQAIVVSISFRITQQRPACYPCIAYTPDGISRIPDNQPGYRPDLEDWRDRLTILLHKRLDRLIEQEQQDGLSRHDHERLKLISTSRSELTSLPSGTGA